MVIKDVKQVVDKSEVENEARRCPVWFPASVFHYGSCGGGGGGWFGCCGDAPAPLVAKQRQLASQMCLQTGTLTLGAAGTSTATRRGAADNPPNQTHSVRLPKW